MSTVLPDIVDDIDLDQIFQDAVAQITGLDGSMVVERFQPIPTRRPEVSDDWCAVGVISAESDDTPIIQAADDPSQVLFIDHERLDVLASFYGPKGSNTAKRLRDGIKIPQNMEALKANGIYLTDARRIQRVGALVNQQFQNRYDLGLVFMRRVERLYPIGRFESVQIHIFDDHPQNKPVFDRIIEIVPPNT